MWTIKTVYAHVKSIVKAVSLVLTGRVTWEAYPPLLSILIVRGRLAADH
jgi:hypothetical protein